VLLIGARSLSATRWGVRERLSGVANVFRPMAAKPVIRNGKPILT